MTEIHGPHEPPTTLPRPAIGRLRAEVATAVVSFWKEHFGRGPSSTKAFIDDNYVFVVLSDGLTRSEQTMVDCGHEQVVRDYRVCFNETMGPELSKVVAEIMGCNVIAHHSQVTFEPPTTFEIFILDESPSGDGAPLLEVGAAAS